MKQTHDPKFSRMQSYEVNDSNDGNVSSACITESDDENSRPGLVLNQSSKSPPKRTNLINGFATTNQR